ncbi:hypothetical protein HNP37_004661 [Flavobacterium nitrogenifigens]|uniref:PcfK-like protein n=2 Tax=Flavobacterium TaxID=237 RepID=A0A7W7J1L5_9FLAO|nr:MULTISPECIES: Cas9 inhibitor AcrIIA9 family protein [Flavobacterium]MBB4804564.1 hypothetical protein [Flavobacterium nitrogenifigens]MBB6389523.1 hypothetical protein [Flavobacterium notoginsengisoli]
MKGADKFNTAIENYLNEAAKVDAVFAQHYGKAAKSLESCFNYIFGEVKKTGCCGFDNQEIFDMAVKYYTDDTIGVPAPIKCRVEVIKPAANDLFSCPAEVPQPADADNDAEVSENRTTDQSTAESQNNLDVQNTADAHVDSGASVNKVAAEAAFSKKVAAAKKSKSDTLTLFDL